MVYNPKSGPILRPPAAIAAPLIAHFRVVFKIVKHLEIKISMSSSVLQASSLHLNIHAVATLLVVLQAMIMDDQPFISKSLSEVALKGEWAALFVKTTPRSTWCVAE